MNPFSKLYSLPELADRPESEKRAILLFWWELRWKRVPTFLTEIAVGFVVYAGCSFILEKLMARVFGSFNPFHLLSTLCALPALWLAVVAVVRVFYLPRHAELPEVIVKNTAKH